MKIDFELTGHGTLYLLRPVSRAASACDLVVRRCRRRAPVHRPAHRRRHRRRTGCAVMATTNYAASPARAGRSWTRLRRPLRSPHRSFPTTRASTDGLTRRTADPLAVSLLSRVRLLSVRVCWGPGQSDPG
jgi:hypothetical protein